MNEPQIDLKTVKRMALGTWIGLGVIMLPLMVMYVVGTIMEASGKADAAFQAWCFNWTRWWVFGMAFGHIIGGIGIWKGWWVKVRGGSAASA